MALNAQIPEPTGFHPAGRRYRFVVLLFVSLLTYGSYFAYDSVGAIPDICSMVIAMVHPYSKTVVQSSTPSTPKICDLASAAAAPFPTS